MYTFSASNVVGHGVSDVHIQQSKVTVGDPDLISPTRSGTESQESDRQPYEAPNDDWVSEDRTTPLRWFKAGVQGKPWTMGRQVSYSAKFEIPHITIKKMNLDTGKPEEVSNTPTSVPGSGTCPSAGISVNVYRAHNVR